MRLRQIGYHKNTVFGANNVVAKLQSATRAPYSKEVQAEAQEAIRRIQHRQYFPTFKIAAWRPPLPPAKLATPSDIENRINRALAVLNDECVVNRMMAIDFLGRYGRESAKVTAGLLKQLTDPVYMVRESAAYSLGCMASLDKDAMMLLLRYERLDTIKQHIGFSRKWHPLLDSLFSPKEFYSPRLAGDIIVSLPTEEQRNALKYLKEPSTISRLAPGFHY